MRAPRFGPQSLTWWAYAICTHAALVIVSAWGDNADGWPLIMLLLPFLLALVLAALARRSGAPQTCRALVMWAAAIGCGCVAGLIRSPMIHAPTPWARFDAGVVSGFVVAVEADRLLLAEPCFVPARPDSAIGNPEPEPDCDGPPRLTVARQGWDEADIVPRTMVRVEVELRERRTPDNPTTLPPSPPSPHRFWAKALSEVQPAPDLSTPLLLDVAGFIRERLTFASASGQRATALFQALILGDRSEIAPATRYAYQDTGTAHLLAISGFNLALFGFGFFRLSLFFLVRLPWFRTRPAPARIAAALALAVTTFYTALIIPTDATDRALIAIVLSLGLYGLGYETRASRTIAACFLIALLLDPMAFTRAGFQLSFAATVSLVIAAPITQRATRAIQASPHFQHRIIRNLAIGLTAIVICDFFTFLATMPIGLVWFGQASLHALWVNLIAIPWMGLVVFPAGLIHLAIATILPPLAELIDPIVAAIGVSFETFIISAGDFIGSQQTTPWPWWMGWTTAGLVFVLFARARMVAILASIATITLLVAWLVSRHGSGLMIDVLDVGHGDAIVVRHPAGGVMLVDTGGGFTPEASRAVAERVLVPALGALGVSRIDLLVITHADRDHIGAAPALAERIPIDNLWLAPCTVDTVVGRELRERVERHGGQVHTVTAQAPMRWGDDRHGHAPTIEVLWPLADSRRWDGRCEWDSNDASLVLKVSSAEGSILLTGDIEAPAEAALVELHGRALASDVLKVPHHGSKTSSTDAFLDAVSPSLALVSGLPDRAPMPPHDIVLDRYAARGIAIAMTGRDGALALRPDDEGTWRLVSRHGAGPRWSRGVTHARAVRSASDTPSPERAAARHTAMTLDTSSFIHRDNRAASDMNMEDWPLLRSP